MEASTLSAALTEVSSFVTQAFSYMTEAPMIYFLVIGLLGGAIGLFRKAKKAAK